MGQSPSRSEPAAAIEVSHHEPRLDDLQRLPAHYLPTDLVIFLANWFLSDADVAQLAHSCRPAMAMLQRATYRIKRTVSLSEAWWFASDAPSSEENEIPPTKFAHEIQSSSSSIITHASAASLPASELSDSPIALIDDHADFTVRMYAICTDTFGLFRPSAVKLKSYRFGQVISVRVTQDDVKVLDELAFSSHPSILRPLPFSIEHFIPASVRTLHLEARSRTNKFPPTPSFITSLSLSCAVCEDLDRLHLLSHLRSIRIDRVAITQQLSPRDRLTLPPDLVELSCDVSSLFLLCDPLPPVDASLVDVSSLQLEEPLLESLTLRLPKYLEVFHLTKSRIGDQNIVLPQFVWPEGLKELSIPYHPALMSALSATVESLALWRTDALSGEEMEPIHLETLPPNLETLNLSGKFTVTSLPASLRTLIIQHNSSMPLHTLTLPPKLQTLFVPNFCSKPSDDFFVPPSLQSLHLLTNSCASNFYFPVWMQQPDRIWQIREIDLRYTMNQQVKNFTLPNGLQRLVLPGFLGNEDMSQLYLPDTLHELVFGDNFASAVEGMRFPRQLHRISFEMRSGANSPTVVALVPAETWPASLRELFLMQTPSNDLRNWHPPKSVRLLKILGNMNHPLPAQMQWPPELEELHLSAYFTHPLDEWNPPNTLRTIVFARESRWNLPLTSMKLPPFLTSITMPSQFNKSLEGHSFPPSLTELTFQDHSFQSPLKPLSKLSQLRILRLPFDFKGGFSGFGWSIPAQALTHLHVGRFEPDTLRLARYLPCSPSISSLPFGRLLSLRVLTLHFASSFKGVDLDSLHRLPALTRLNVSTRTSFPFTFGQKYPPMLSTLCVQVEFWNDENEGVLFTVDLPCTLRTFGIVTAEHPRAYNVLLAYALQGIVLKECRLVMLRPEQFEKDL